MHTFVNITLILLRIVEILIIIRCILSFIPQLRDNQIVRLIIKITEPVLTPARLLINKYLSKNVLNIDFSPIVTYFFLIIIRIIITSII